MKSAKIWLLFASLGATSFVVAFWFGKGWRSGEPATEAATREMSHAEKLTRLGAVEGKQLVVYVFGSSKCVNCIDPAIVRSLPLLRERFRREVVGYTQISIVGVSINSDLADGLGYLKKFGLKNFDEISIGRGWKNELLTRIIWRDSTQKALLPQIVVVSHSVTADTDPFRFHFSVDSVVKVVTGRQEITSWFNDSTALIVSGRTDDRASHH